MEQDPFNHKPKQENQDLSQEERQENQEHAPEVDDVEQPQTSEDAHEQKEQEKNPETMLFQFTNFIDSLRDKYAEMGIINERGAISFNKNDNMVRVKLIDADKSILGDKYRKTADKSFKLMWEKKKLARKKRKKPWWMSDKKFQARKIIVGGDLQSLKVEDERNKKDLQEAHEQFEKARVGFEHEVSDDVVGAIREINKRGGFHDGLSDRYDQFFKGSWTSRPGNPPLAELFDNLVDEAQYRLTKES